MLLQFESDIAADSRLARRISNNWGGVWLRRNHAESVRRMKSQGRCEVGGYEIGVGHRFHACQKLETFDLATDAFEPPLHALGSACPPVPPTSTHIRCGIPACARTNHPLMTALSAPAALPAPSSLGASAARFRAGVAAVPRRSATVGGVESTDSRASLADNNGR